MRDGWKSSALWAARQTMAYVPGVSTASHATDRSWMNDVSRLPAESRPESWISSNACAWPNRLPPFLYFQMSHRRWRRRFCERRWRRRREKRGGVSGEKEVGDGEWKTIEVIAAFGHL